VGLGEALWVKITLDLQKPLIRVNNFDTTHESDTNMIRN
jgi:hypothetical protein